ncbi:MAG: YfcE family phosphodiesterase [Isosphaeraceae bacterium]|nr:YfcE family phosphodiesterase [Isosphaeraceae bacterium]
MRIGILSDTHDQVARTARAVTILVGQGVEALIHCGDYTCPEVILECGGMPSYYVFGNNDFDQADLRRAMAAVGGVCLEWGGVAAFGTRRVAVTHGDSEPEMRRLAGLGPYYLLFGHSHRKADERRGATRWVNPGALYRASEWTVAVLDLNTDGVTFHSVDARRG